MQNIRRVLVRVGLGGLMFLAGVVVGAVWAEFHYAIPLSQGGFEQFRKAQEQEAYLCYRFGRHDKAKCRLLAYAENTSRGLGVLHETDQHRAKESMGLAYARIATLAARDGRAEEETLFLRRAKDAYRSMGVVLTDEDLRQSVKDEDSAWDARIQGCPQ